MAQNRQSNTASRPDYCAQVEPAARLADTVREVLENQISPRHRKLNSVVACWRQTVPAELARHSRITGICAGRLKVLVDGPSYVYELRLRKPELLRELQQRCPHARLHKIDLALG